MTSASTPSVTVRTEGTVCHVRLNRPEKRNSLNAEIVEALITAVHDAQTSDSRLIVFHGEGKSFSAGFDFTDLESQSDPILSHRFLRIETLLQEVASSRIATLALAHGPTFGAGADLFTACDERILDPGSTLRFPGLRFGVVLGTRRLIDRAGTEFAQRALAEARTITAEEAEAVDLATGLAPRDRWPAVIDEASRRADLLSADATTSLKRALEAGSGDAAYADLARSVATPGLKERMQEYVEGARR